MARGLGLCERQWHYVALAAHIQLPKLVPFGRGPGFVSKLRGMVIEPVRLRTSIITQKHFPI